MGNMKRLGLLLISLAILTAWLPAHGMAADLDITVYNGDIGLVKEIRTLTLNRGINHVAVKDVPSKIIPESVHFSSLDDPDAVVLEQNYEYDVVGARKLLEKYVDKSIVVITKDGSSHKGTLLSGAGDIIIRGEDGTIEVLKLDQVRQFSFPSLPKGLITTPTLNWLLNTTAAGIQKVELSYLTRGLTWNANYVLVLAGSENELALDGWITLDNRSGTSYDKARLKLVAGEVHRASTNRPPRLMKGRMMLAEMPAAPVEERKFSEYHLYEIPRPVTIKNNQTKQIQFLSVKKVPAEKIFIFDSRSIQLTRTDSGAMKGNILVKVRFNTGKGGIDAQLPAGIVRLYQPDQDSSLLFIGEDRIDHTPKGEKVSLTVGEAFDLIGERKQTGTKRLSDRVWRESYEIVIRNHKEEEAEVHVIEHLSSWISWEILKASPRNYSKLNSSTIEWIVTVPAGGSVKVYYTVEYNR